MSFPNLNPTTELSPFQFECHKLRVIVDEYGEPWFIAKEVADILGYSDAHKMTERLDEGEKKNRQIRGFGPRGVITIIESGLFACILGSQKPEAKPLWVDGDQGSAIAKRPGIPTLDCRPLWPETSQVQVRQVGKRFEP